MPKVVRTVAQGIVACVAMTFSMDAPCQDTATRPTDADSGSSYLLRQSTLWYDRWISGLFTHATATLDIDKDGDLDAFVAPGDGQNARMPARIMVNQGNGTFADGTASRLSNAQPGIFHARKALVGDYNHDGWPDVFIAGHGYDAPPFAGEYPQLFLSNGDGTLRYDAQLSGLVGFDHAAASGDIDRNGSVDILVVQQGSPYVLLNDGLGNFSKNTSLLPAELLWKNYFSSELVDVDRDGWLDLLIGGHEFENAPTTLYWGSQGGWSANRKYVFPAVADKGIVLDFAAEDIDGDGMRDLVADRSGQTPFYSGRSFQILRQVSPRQFADETGARITMDTGQGWIDYFRLQDIDDDQDPDLLIDDKHRTFDGAYAWVNDGHGVFTPYAGAVSPLPALSIDPAAIVEGDNGQTFLQFTIRSTQPVIGSTLVRVETRDGTAIVGSDYQGISVPVQIYPGQSSATVGLTVFSDTDVEPNESIAATLVQPTGATIRQRQARGTIVNDDLAALSIADASITEGAVGTRTLRFVVSLGQPMHAPVRFDVATGNASATAGSDYVATVQAGRTLDAGRTAQAVEIAVLGDAATEPDETFTVTLSNLVGAAAGRLVATGTIGNDDGAPSTPVQFATAAPIVRALRTADPAASPSCTELASRVAAIETQVAKDSLGERSGIARIVLLEARAARARCKAL